MCTRWHAVSVIRYYRVYVLASTCSPAQVDICRCLASISATQPAHHLRRCLHDAGRQVLRARAPGRDLHKLQDHASTHQSAKVIASRASIACSTMPNPHLTHGQHSQGAQHLQAVQGVKQLLGHVSVQETPRKRWHMGWNPALRTRRLASTLTRPSAPPSRYGRGLGAYHTWTAVLTMVS